MGKEQINDGGKKKRRLQNIVLDYLHDLVFLLAILLLVFVLVFRIVVVSGPSMKNTLLDGDYLIVLSSALAGDPEPGDIIVASKADFKNGEPIIKRVIATGGQTVDIDFNTGIVTVDGLALDEPYVREKGGILDEGVNFPLTVDEGCLFVMGDNRNNSMDSRDPDIGLIDERQVLGHAIFLVFPGNDSGREDRDFGRIGVP